MNTCICSVTACLKCVGYWKWVAGGVLVLMLMLMLMVQYATNACFSGCSNGMIRNDGRCKEGEGDDMLSLACADGCLCSCGDLRTYKA